MPYDAPVYDPYNPAVPDYDPETLPLDEVILEAMRAHTMGLRVALPATVTAINSGENQRVDVLPSLMARDANAPAATPMPAIKNVAVLMTAGANYSIKVPVSVGDHGLVVFCDRSLDAWSASDGTSLVDPQDSRQHDLTDAVFIPGVVPFALQLTDATTDLVVQCGTAQLRLQQSGRFKMGTASADVLDLMDQTLTQAGSLAGDLAGVITQTSTALNGISVASLTGSGAGVPVVFATPFSTYTAPAVAALTTLKTAVTQVQTTLQQIQTTLQGLKGM